MRHPLVMGNWKLNGSTHMVNELIAGLRNELSSVDGCGAAIAPPVMYLDQAKHALAGTRYWSLTERGHAYVAADQERLRASALQLFGGAGVEPLLSAREEQLYLRYTEELSAERSHQDRLTRLVRLRQHDGYMAELLDHPHGALLVENHCPIGVAGSNCSSLCNSELQLFHRLFGNNYRVERTAHAISGSRHCAYLIRPREL